MGYCFRYEVCPPSRYVPGSAYGGERRESLVIGFESCREDGTREQRQQEEEKESLDKEQRQEKEEKKEVISSSACVRPMAREEEDEVTRTTDASSSSSTDTAPEGPCPQWLALLPPSSLLPLPLPSHLYSDTSRSEASSPSIFKAVPPELWQKFEEWNEVRILSK